MSLSGATSSRQNVHGSLWLLTCLTLNAVALGLIKGLGASVPTGQMVFLRGLFGILLFTPWIWGERGAFINLDRWGLHVLRMTLAGLGLLASFHAVAHLPLALFTAIDLSRALALMVMAYLFLREQVSTQRWIAAIVGLAGVLIATSPTNVPWSSGLAAALAMVLCISASIIVLKMLSATSPIVLVTFFSIGVMIVSAPLAAKDWVPLSPMQASVLLGVSLCSQLAQYCLAKAHYLAEASVLAPLGYLSLVLAGIVGYIAFAEVPSQATLVGSALIIGAAAVVTLLERAGNNQQKP